MGDAPYIIIPKHRQPSGTYKRSVRIARVWRHKETGNVVEIRALRNIVPDNYLRVVFWDPTLKQELSMPMHPGHANPFQRPGAQYVEMEPAFTEHYEPYTDQRSTRV